MYAITGISGKVGGAVARTLLAEGHAVRAVVRDAAKGEAWAKQGCQVALAEMNDAAALQSAFSGVDGVFILMPSNFAPSPGFPEVRRILAALHQALAAARPAKVVCLSTIGAQATQTNLLTQLQIMETELGRLDLPLTFLRPAWFMENALWDVAPARNDGVIPSFLQPLDKPVPMIATADVGRVAAELLLEQWQGRRIVELEGPERITPNQIAATFAELLAQPVRVEAVPRETWRDIFSAQGAIDPEPRMRMLDGFNQGWIEFAGTARKGKVTLATVLKQLLAAQAV
ncbi:NmrA family NAD(P)-binding protein [Collimonas pratensis]|uniref:NAD dependent epimerase/dehydratase family protein n=1 Tax=Collimonas pratensis TaxID=279113 RepID=A0A127Q0Y6_9BURK|nr:NmrA family NAD(P)-binding protein [Collimonas pratensis]AMP03666.1 NAD dependent epimerase/dehydratase family protein [Collimonas pratensis]NKI68222.1 NmrA family NAD(P)-binding protein [Collimonas pratensis]